MAFLSSLLYAAALDCAAPGDDRDAQNSRAAGAVKAPYFDTGAQEFRLDKAQNIQLPVNHVIRLCTTPFLCGPSLFIGYPFWSAHLVTTPYVSYPHAFNLDDSHLHHKHNQGMYPL